MDMIKVLLLYMALTYAGAAGETVQAIPQVVQQPSAQVETVEAVQTEEPVVVIPTPEEVPAEETEIPAETAESASGTEATPADLTERTEAAVEQKTPRLVAGTREPKQTEAPEESPAPTAVITETPAPTVAVPVQETATPSPTPTFSPTPSPVPTPTPQITPNKSYRILRRKSKGDDVRRLQERLRELGYLNGTADGAFGDMTYRAVIAFQRANGLQPDGQAGPATQTMLFENPGVIPNLSAMTPTPEPTGTPGPDGLSPMPADGTGSWMEIHLHTVICNSESLVLTRADGLREAPGLWLRGEICMLSLQDLSDACGWAFLADSGENFSLQALGYDIDVTVLLPALELREGADGYCDGYAATDAGVPLDVRQGDIVSEKGKWYVSLNFLKVAMHAETTWDEDENTMILRIREKDQILTAD